jgi:hypothetical protein
MVTDVDGRPRAHPQDVQCHIKAFRIRFRTYHVVAADNDI